MSVENHESEYPEHPHISLSVPEMKPHYDVVVIGSGYGGGIAASRKERWPGEYPTETHDCFKEAQYESGKTRKGKKTGMYRFYYGGDQAAVTGCGLGGTSLINANVALEADKRVWEMSAWPEEIRKDKEGIKLGYKRAKEMLQPEPYPEHFPVLPKLKVLEEQANKLGPEYAKNFYRPPITVTFENRVNSAGVRQLKSTLTGNDTAGANDGSKNTTLVNYISDAWNHGCEIFCQINVQRIKKDKKTGKWVVFYEWLDDGREEFSDNHSLYFVMADVVFLAAGTLGSNEILLRSRNFGLEVSSQVGEKFSGNGDVNHKCNAVAMGDHNPSNFSNGPVGPCITGIIDMRQSGDSVYDGYVIEEGACPAPCAKILSTYFKIVNTEDKNKPTNLTFSEKFAKFLREISSNTSNYQGAMANTQSYLIMSHDHSNGRIQLVNDKVNIEFNGVGELEMIKKLNETLSRATININGDYISSPLWLKVFGCKLITVHPLGGCCMGKDGTGTTVHKDLYICDGSIVPTSLAVNPFLTISCLAERIMNLAAKDRGWVIDYELVKQPIDWNKPLKSWNLEVTKQHASPDGGIKFTESLKGYFSTEIVSEDYQAAELQAKTSESKMQILLTVISPNAKSLVELEDHSALITGTMSCRALSPDPLIITKGNFRLFITDEDRVDSKKLMYNFNLLSTNGEKYQFMGFKLLTNSSMFEEWTETTTIYSTIYEYNNGNENNLSDDVDTNRKVIGRGILYVTVSDFRKQLQTLMPFYHKPRPEKEMYVIESNDKIKTLIHRFKGGSKGPVLLIHGAAMSYEMWATNLVEHTFLDYLLENGYDVWLNDSRLSPTNAECYKQFPLDAVRLDQKAAIDHVRKITECDKIAVVAHCLGSISTLMGLLDGSIEGVGSLVTSQVSVNPINGFVNVLKRNFQLLPIYRHILRQDLFDVRTSPDTNLLNRIVDQCLRFYPVPKHQVCNDALCHRASLCYGALYQHENLNQLIHDYQSEFFGTINLTTMNHMVYITAAQKIVNYDKKDVYVTEENVKKNLNLPIFLIHGDKNVIFDKKSSQKSYDTLINYAQNPDIYSMYEIPGYGHMDSWWGNDAHKDVFPKVLDHLENTKDTYGYALKASHDIQGSHSGISVVKKIISEELHKIGNGYLHEN
ncbi:24497_t:CDS:10, partial [Gigaspora margarita]